VRYIGSKNLLLDEIDNFLSPHLSGEEKTFLDLFAGTNVVSAFFKKRYSIISNDILYFSFVNAKAIIEGNDELRYDGLLKKGISDPVSFLENESLKYIEENHVGYYEESYSPTGGVMYFTVENAKKIDYMREQLEVWKDEFDISSEEYHYLLATLLSAIPYVSNITGTYGAFLKHWDKRALNPLVLRPLTVEKNFKSNKAYNIDSNELVKEVIADITYIDTPYNSRQYASNYHVLENIARHTKPPLKGKTKIFDWKELRSDYSVKKNAYETMKDLIKNVQSEHVVISYSSDGIIEEDKFVELIKGYSYDKEVKVKKIKYRKYKSKVKSESDELYELLFYFKKSETKTTLKTQKTINTKETWNLAPKFVKSPLNYIGGKYKLLNQLVPLFPNNIKTFVDVFSGGCNVGINIPAKNHIFNDMNVRLNELFEFLHYKNPDDVIALIENRINEFQLTKTNCDGFLRFRDTYNENPNPLDLYVLVSFSYNYQIRFNNNMKFNNPFGRDRSHFSMNMKQNLYNFMTKLNCLNANFSTSFFENLNYFELSENDFVYFDPPYLITIGNYNDGNRGFRNWDEVEEKKLYKIMDILTEQGVRWALSNVLTHKEKENKLLVDFVNANGYNITDLDYNYNNSSYNSKKKGSREVLITNYCTKTFELTS